MPRKGSTGVASSRPQKVVDEDEVSDVEAEDETPSRRRSTRTPKPVVRKSLRDASDSDGSEASSDDGSSKRGKRNTKSVPKKGGVKRAVNGAGGANKAKRAKKNSDEDFSGEEDDEEDEEPKTSKGGKRRSKKKNADEDEEEDDDEVNYDFDVELDDDADWEEPDYNDEKWFKKNCLICQLCEKVFDHTGDALNCFHKHKEDHLRCYVCFTILKGGKDGTKRLFKHYQKRHQKGDKQNTVKCPHCNESFAYKSVSCHIISIHFREVLGIPDKAKEAASTSNGNAAVNGKGKSKKSKSKKRSDDEEDEEEEEEESVNEDEEEDDDEEDDD